MLRERIFKQLEKMDMGQRQLAKIVNVSESTISRYLNGRDELKFESTLRIVQYLFPAQEKSLIVEYALTQKSYNARCCLEYCLIHNIWDVNDRIIEKLSHSGNPIDREWAKIYEYVLNYHRKDMSDEELLEQVLKFHPNSFEVNMMKKILLGYIYFFQKNFNLMLEHIRDLDQKILEVKSTFIQSCLVTRYGLIMMHVHMFLNHIPETRRLCELVIEQCMTNNAKASAYHALGHSYLFEDYDKAQMYLTLAMELFKNEGRQENYLEAYYTLSFVQSYWRIEREFPFELHTQKELDEYIFYLIQKGDIAIAREICKKMNVESMDDWEKAFYYYYLGLMEDHKTFFYQSVRYFRQAQNRFHLQLPIYALKNKNENETLLQIFNDD
ncbi:AimR family lysis-lysogeny pheromone receptor [Bacillus horti]|uniref:Transcriptional regulator with XRE-family HTH domain n=1 Tax=Caldalkalibacillus horti TaxID=77523 RepID=A0ABT9VXY6_9BACI|nr:AimR family lysis-lysogeny pheromone receptor [Bacillus horti]MDQ0165841.1 transcriptional regulator with XRE-family HTH domain [Bacillus horti]